MEVELAGNNNYFTLPVNDCFDNDRGEVINGGFGLVLDGTEEAVERLKMMLSWDVLNGVCITRPYIIEYYRILNNCFVHTALSSQLVWSPPSQGDSLCSNGCPTQAKNHHPSRGDRQQSHRSGHTGLTRLSRSLLCLYS